MNYDLFIYKLSILKDRFHTWLYWTVSGWPNKRRCPICCGTKIETLGDYGESYSQPCSHCRATGWVKRYYH